MTKAKTIRIEIYKPGEGNEAHEYDYCPLSKGGDHCRLYGRTCKYGLTEVSIPVYCSMNTGEIVIKLKVKNAK